MTTSEPDNGPNRDDLLQRIELMEAMIAEGRGFTTRHGWIFVLWGLVDLVAWTWQRLAPHSHTARTWAWPVCLAIGAVATILGKSLQTSQKGWSRNMQCRSVEAVWVMMGIALAIYVACEMIVQLTWQYSYVAALLLILGLAHAISATILRWAVQGVVAATWWAGAIAVLFVHSAKVVQYIMLLEMCLGMIAFGVYAMLLERRDGGTGVSNNAA